MGRKVFRVTTFPVNEDRSVTADYINQTVKSLIANGMYHANDPQSIFIIFSFLSQRQIPFSLQYHVGSGDYIMRVRIYIGDDEYLDFRGRSSFPNIAAGIGMMLAIEATKG